MTRLRLVLLRTLAAPLAAIVFAIAVSSVALLASGASPLEAFSTMWRFGTRFDSVISTLNRAIPLYLSGLAVAVGFKMGLFNIGVEGQYRLAAVLAAAVGAAVRLPPVLHVTLIILVGVAVGMVWAGIPGILKVTRGVHEVISTIMMNAIAVGLAAYLLSTYLRDPSETLVIKTHPIAPSGQFPSLNRLLEAVGLEITRGNLQGFLVIAILVGVAYYVLLWRTRFGYDLRASGINPFAAQVSGVHAGGMVIRAMLISGGIAGLVGMSQILGFFHLYSIDFPQGLGFTGIVVALLGRNHPLGIGFGALLFGFLGRAGQGLQLVGIPKEVEVIMGGTIVLSVVIAYEVVSRVVRDQEAKAAAAAAPQGPALAA
ncbi:MAG: ABC transporter permease, partial [Nitriliruptorales bacterium]